MKKTTLKNSVTNKRSLILLLAVVMSAAIFSCNEPNTVGLEVQPESDQPNLSFTDTVTLETSVVREDSVATYNAFLNVLNAALIGSMYETDFGQSTANVYTAITPNSTSPDFTTGVFDSIVLTLAYKSFYGDSLTPQTFTVYQMDTSLSSSATYYSNQNFPFNPTPIGTATLLPMPTSTVYLGTDTLLPHLRIRLNDAFGKNIFDSASSYLISANVFKSKMKGVFIQTTPITSGGGIITYNPNAALSGMTIYYTDTVNTGNAKKTFAFNTTGVGRSAAFTHDYTNTLVGNILNAQGIANDKAYVQSMAGVKTKITIPYLDALKTLMPVAINKAELVITVDPGTTTPLAAITQFGLARTDTSGKMLSIPEQFLEGSTYFGGALNSNVYRFNIARYLQDVLSGAQTDYGLFILAGNGAVNPNRTIIGGGGNSNPSIKLKLQLTYTKLNQ